MKVNFEMVISVTLAFLIANAINKLFLDKALTKVGNFESADEFND